MGKLSEPVLDLVKKFNLNLAFFKADANPLKADLWFQEAQKLILRCELEHIGVVANTGAGKTVIALLVAIMSGKRTLFLVPNKDLVFGHLLLLYAMGANLQAKTITGDYSFGERVWDDIDDRIIFATASVVEKEISYGELDLCCFDLIVGDEVHHATSENTAYAKVSQATIVRKLWWLSLTASPGNKPERIMAVRKYFQIDDFVKINIKTPGVNTSVVIAEEAEVCSDINYIKAEELVISELDQALEKVGTTSMQMALGKKLQIDPKKTFKRKDVDMLRKQIHTIGKLQLGDPADQKLHRRLASNLERYAFWAHVYELFKAESFVAIKHYYQDNLCKKTTFYAKDIIKKGSAQMLLALTNNLTHPKEEMLGRVIESFNRRNIQSLVFESNKATAIGDYHYLHSLGIATDCIFSGKGMTPTVKKSSAQ